MACEARAAFPNPQPEPRSGSIGIGIESIAGAVSPLLEVDENGQTTQAGIESALEQLADRAYESYRYEDDQGLVCGFSHHIKQIADIVEGMTPKDRELGCGLIIPIESLQAIKEGLDILHDCDDAAVQECHTHIQDSLLVHLEKREPKPPLRPIFSPADYMDHTCMIPDPANDKLA